MSDILTIEQRHHYMSNEKNKNTKPELLVRKFLFSHGYRYRVNRKVLPSTPDIVLPKYKTVVFINGCFWHGHENCKYATILESKREFWFTKINGNVERDKLPQEKLISMSWRVIDIWKCQLKAKDKETTLNNLVTILSNE